METIGDCSEIRGGGLISAERIHVVNESIKEERCKHGEFFNIFDVLNVQAKEVRLHSAFIAELLNPDSLHGLKDKFLLEFLEEIKMKNFQTYNARVFTEKYKSL